MGVSFADEATPTGSPTTTAADAAAAPAEHVGQHRLQPPLSPRQVDRVNMRQVVRHETGTSVNTSAPLVHCYYTPGLPGRGV